MEEMTDETCLECFYSTAILLFASGDSERESPFDGRHGILGNEKNQNPHITMMVAN